MQIGFAKRKKVSTEFQAEHETLVQSDSVFPSC